jgi:prophage tail gpP-like protein
MKVKINNKNYFFFNNFRVSLKLDSVGSVFSFLANFNPDNNEHKELFKPLSFNKIEIYKDDNELLLTGYIIDLDFTSEASPKLVKVSGYSLGGVLEDSNIPYTSYPLESIKRSLADISRKIFADFGLNVVIDSSVAREMDLIYDKSTAEPTESIKSYISKLASQRNIVLSHNAKGDIVFFRPSFNLAPKYLFNALNTTAMSLNVKGQNMRSKIWVLRQPSPSNDNLTPVDEVVNNMVTLFRPGVKTLSSGIDTDTAKAVKNILAAQLKNIVIQLQIPKWLPLKPGDLIEVQNKEIYLYNKTKLVISELDFDEDEKSTTMSITALLPESYTGEQPKNIFE